MYETKIKMTVKQPKPKPAKPFVEKGNNFVFIAGEGYASVFLQAPNEFDGATSHRVNAYLHERQGYTHSTSEIRYCGSEENPEILMGRTGAGMIIPYSQLPDWYRCEGVDMIKSVLAKGLPQGSKDHQHLCDAVEQVASVITSRRCETEYPEAVARRVLFDPASRRKVYRHVSK